MCGIFGAVQSRDFEQLTVYLPKISELLHHRGPDGQGFLSYSPEKGIQPSKTLDQFSAGQVVLLHKRLAILDLSNLGWQPMISADRSIAITFNGEIYNFLEIKKELEQLGYSFSSHSDTEVLLYAYHAWAEACLNKLVGMFAFAILDLKKRVLFCARDFFGIKPFYYSASNSFFYFASEPKVLLTLSEVSTRPNNQLIYEYLVYGSQENIHNSFFKDIQQLPPAHYLTVSLDDVSKINCVRYWNVNPITNHTISRQEAAEHLRYLFENSVNMHMRSDVPVAANLSGGIDSSSIVMVAKKILEQNFNLHTISFIADDEKINEEKWIDIVNRAANSKGTKVKYSSEDFLTELDELITSQDEPFGSSSPFAQFQVFKNIHALGIKVVLDGQGADELLAGYRSYLFAFLKSLLGHRQYLKALYFSARFCMLPGIQKNIIMSFFYQNFLQRHVRSTSMPSSIPPLLNSAWVKRSNIDLMNQTPSFDKEIMKQQLLYTFQNSSLPHLLRVADRNSMNFSVESRLPFLIPQIAEFIFSLPEDYIIDYSATTKSIFRKSMQGIVPDEVLNRRDKIGFSTPEESWLKANQKWVTNLFQSDTVKNSPFFNQKFLVEEWKKLLNNSTHFDWRFWRWINLIRWSEIYQVQYD